MVFLDWSSLLLLDVLALLALLASLIVGALLGVDLNPSWRRPCDFLKVFFGSVHAHKHMHMCTHISGMQAHGHAHKQHAITWTSTRMQTHAQSTNVRNNVHDYIYNILIWFHLSLCIMIKSNLANNYNILSMRMLQHAHQNDTHTHTHTHTHYNIQAFVRAPTHTHTHDNA